MKEIGDIQQEEERGKKVPDSVRRVREAERRRVCLVTDEGRRKEERFENEGEREGERKRFERKETDRAEIGSSWAGALSGCRIYARLSFITCATWGAH